MKLLSIAFIFLLISIKGYSQQGTLVIIAIFNNEIVVAADSRGSFYESEDKNIGPMAYIDSCNKILKLNQFILAIAGPSSIGKRTYIGIIDEFNKTSPQETDLKIAMENLRSYLDKNFPVNLFPERKRAKFFGVGYVNNKPLVIYTDSTGIIKNTDRGVIMNNGEAYKYQKRTAPGDNKLTHYDQMENTIYDYAKGENKVSSIGGPVSIVSIIPGNDILWVKNDFSRTDSCKTSTDIYNDIKSGKRKVYYLVPNGKERLLKVFFH
jgi:hypothetical protein